MAFQINPGIAASGGMPQFDPMGAFAQALQLRGFQEQQQALVEQRRAMADARRQAADAQRQEMEFKQRALAEDQELRKLFSGSQQPTPEAIYSVVGPQRGAEIVKGLAALRTQEIKDYGELQQVIGTTLGGITALPEPMKPEAYKAVREQFITRGWLHPEQVPADYSPEFVTMAQRWALTPQQQLEADKPIEVSAGASLMSPAGQVVGTAPIADKPAAVGSFEDYLRTRFGPRPTAEQIEKARVRYESLGRAPVTDNEPLVPVMGPDGKPVLVRRSQAEGKTPASIREQGRQVTSGDAGAIAELDTSLDDITALRSALKGTKGATGVGAKVGAVLPNFVTEITGIGSQAKQRQAVIDRVKQVIGKALEGGVLRKEDEIKYEKILPTIGDPDPVVEAKLNGLERALALRRSRQLDALADAGYDVSRYHTRAEQRGLDPGKVNLGRAPGGLVPMIAPDGGALMVPAHEVAGLEKLGAKRR